MPSYSFELQQAIYTALTGASPSIVDGDRVYDDVPQAATYPFVEIGDSQVIPDDVSTGDDGLSEFVDLHIWSRYRGKKEVKEIWSGIHTALHGQALTVVGRASACSWVSDVRIILDPDGLTRHGIVTVQVVHRSAI